MLNDCSLSKLDNNDDYYCDYHCVDDDDYDENDYGDKVKMMVMIVMMMILCMVFLVLCNNQVHFCSICNFLEKLNFRFQTALNFSTDHLFACCWFKAG